MHSILTALPTIGLSPFVSHYLQREERLEGVTRTEPVPARSQHLLQFQFRDRYEIRYLNSDRVETGARVAIVGPQTHRRVHLLIRGHMEGFVVVFRPTAFYRLFGIEMNNLVDEAYEASLVMGPEISKIWQRLGNADSFPRRVEIMEQFLGKHADSARPSVSKLTTQIAMHRGSIRIADLAQNANLSARQMERQFRAQVGLPPKLYARIERFESALRMKAAMPEQSWSTVAHELGYCDQMHMVHDFHHLAGENPTDAFARAAYGLSLKPHAWFAFSESD
jgi:AraC-like DNA-binding protein